VEDLKVGDELFAFDENLDPVSKRRYWKKATVLGNKPDLAEVYKIEFSDGTSIEATGDHPFLFKVHGPTKYKWTTVEELMRICYRANNKNNRSLGVAGAESQYMPLRVQRFVPTWTTDESRNAGYLAGFYDGEGCLSQRRKPRRNCGKNESHFTLTVTQLPGPVLDRAKGILDEMGFEHVEADRDPRGQGCRVVTLLGGMGNVLKFLGSIRPTRLLNNFKPDIVGAIKKCAEDVFITSIKPVGVKGIYSLMTDTKTYISEGFLSHNTSYHVGLDEDWENVIADRLEAKIGEHEWVDIEGVVFDLKHHPAGSSGIPQGRHTGVAKDRLWNLMWNERQMQPKASVFIRSHVHHHNFCGGPDWLAMTTPALQGIGSRFGSRRCSGIVDFGFVTFNVNKGEYSWQAHIASIEAQKSLVTKL
jgi:hypothetical protein